MIKTRKFSRTILITAAVLLVSARFSGWSQGISKGQPEDNHPLQFRVIAVPPTSCVGGHIDLELELRNITGRQVVIDPRGISYQISFTSEHGGRTVTSDPGPNPSSGQLITLNQNDSFRKTMMYGLDDPFFSTEGVYRVKLAYGQFARASSSQPHLYRGTIDSNEILFEIHACEAK